MPPNAVNAPVVELTAATLEFNRVCPRYTSKSPSIYTLPNGSRLISELTETKSRLLAEPISNGPSAVI